MTILNFPSPTVDRNDDHNQPAEPTIDPAEALRALLVKTHLRRRARGRRRPKSPASVIAGSLNSGIGRQIGTTRLDPFELLSEWLGVIRPGAQAEPFLALFSLRTEQRPIDHVIVERPAQPPEPARPAASEGGFWPLWIEHRDQMKRIAMRLMQGNEADAEDALSTAMLRAERAFDPEKILNPVAWFNRLVHNACIDHYRHRSRTSTLGDAVEIAPDEAAPTTVDVQNGRSGEEELLSREGLNETLCAILELPGELMEPLMLRCLAERPYEEIAREMDLSNAAVRKRVQLARKYLKDIL